MPAGATSASLNNLTLAVFDANTTEVAYYITYNSTTALNATTSLYVQPIDEVSGKEVGFACLCARPCMKEYLEVGSNVLRAISAGHQGESVWMKVCLLQKVGVEV